MFKLKITLDEEPVVRAKAQNIKDFEPILKGLKEKFNGSKKARY